MVKVITYGTYDMLHYGHIRLLERANTTELQNVRISQNVIIGAGTLVNRNIPENSVACGVPAKIVGTFDEFLAKRMSQKTYPDDCKVSAETIDEHFAKWLWKEFYNIRVNK